MHERRLRTSEWSSAGPQTPINTDHTHDLNKYQLGKNANYQEIRSSAVNFNKFLELIANVWTAPLSRMSLYPLPDRMKTQKSQFPVGLQDSSPVP